jgi:hypothetical protein
LNFPIASSFSRLGGEQDIQLTICWKPQWTISCPVEKRVPATNSVGTKNPPSSGEIDLKSRKPNVAQERVWDKAKLVLPD